MQRDVQYGTDKRIRVFAKNVPILLPIIILARNDMYGEDCAILSAVILIVFLIANFVLYFIFKDRYWMTLFGAI